MPPNCKVCGEPMKPLFQTYFCDVNECDLPEGKRRTKPVAAPKKAKPITWTFSFDNSHFGTPAAPAFCDCPRRFATMYHQGRVICLSCNLEVAAP